MSSQFFSKKQWIFDRWAPFYDIFFTTVFYQAIHKRLLEYVELPEKANILDLGCGTGRLLNRIAQQNPTLQGTGLDLSQEMLKQANVNNKHQSRLRFVEGNAEATPFADNEFDAIFNTISFLHYPNPITVLSEVHRILRPGGKFYLVDYTIRWADEPKVIGMSSGSLRIYSPAVREKLGQQAGLNCVKHQYLLGAIMLTIFSK
ncbi:class I SAM-dependent methyltransferase [Calothrix sp. UHCC 0171]|uniref:class I SAM-dependent methyltransferase n=1 Tax=Calothrix sp. UHCC 0171 TaxID=3110245 RepID=UPI002B1E9712|nr:class I SAM-dependent methyltransferase [Calothrix sp. UHCC 0171]MEA5572313.1 class I SAM-dependent methyltransferase [Calothrix sp. UHCC 0171]